MLLNKTLATFSGYDKPQVKYGFRKITNNIKWSKHVEAFGLTENLNRLFSVWVSSYKYRFSI